MRLIIAALLPPVFIWCFVYAILSAVQDEEYRRSGAGRAMLWVFAAPFVMGEVQMWIVCHPPRMGPHGLLNGSARTGASTSRWARSARA